MHIVFLVDAVDNQNAGIFVYVKNLILTVKKRVESGTDENVYSFVHLKNNSIFDCCLNEKNKIMKFNDYIIPRKKIIGYDSVRRFFLIPKLIRKIKADVVIETCHIGPFGLPKSIRTGVVIHDITPVLFPKWHVWRSVLIHKLFLKHIVKKVNFIITPSENTANDIVEYYGIDRKKCCVAYPSVDLDFKDWKLGENTLNDMFKSENIEITKNNYILYLGTIEPRKNLEFLVENYLKMLGSGLITQKLILAGGLGWKMNLFYEKYRKNSNILFTGYITNEQKIALYRNANLFVYSSLYEGFGIPPLEALSCGIVPVLGRNSSLEEVYKKEACFFEMNDSESLQIAILCGLFKMEFYEVLELTVGDGFVSGFSWENMVDEILGFVFTNDR